MATMPTGSSWEESGSFSNFALQARALEAEALALAYLIFGAIIFTAPGDITEKETAEPLSPFRGSKVLP